MWNKIILALLLVSVESFAEQSALPNINVEKLKQQWQLEQQQANNLLLTQRANFLQLESLLQTAERQGKVNHQVLQLAEQLYDPAYPLVAESDWAILKAKLASEEGKNPDNVKTWLAVFSVKYPDLAKRYKLAQRLFPLYYEQQRFEDLIAYSKSVSPDTNHQCYLFSAQFQRIADQLQINPEAEQAAASSTIPAELQSLLIQFDDFWLQNENLPKECQQIEAYWRDKGFKSDEKVRGKAVKLLRKKAKSALVTLANNANSELAIWLNSVQELLNSPDKLPTFAENQPLDLQNKSILLITFPRFIKTLPEKMEEAPDFSIYQRWAEHWHLSEPETQEWKISFINHFFDHNDPIFELCRDEQIKQLSYDPLTERRLRMAIWQKTELNKWLSLLSESGKAKAEWRYWLAKANPTRSKEIFETLAKERGFYPMLAANQLKKSYRPTHLDAQPLTDVQKETFKHPLARIAELRELQRFNAAKVVWVDLLQAVSFDEKLALATYASAQKWYDLAVEATIQAKAWDYLALRLPNAYQDWFAMNLRDKPIRQSFAMAIARQESAWSFQVRSPANAIGLMQMLPTTAQATAKNSQLPYQNEGDLLAPFKNIMLGTTHLTELNQKYPNNRILLAAAYNAGGSRVEKWLARSAGKLTMDEFIASIPFFETRGYVQNVLAYDFYYQMLYGSNPVLFYPEELRMY